MAFMVNENIVFIDTMKFMNCILDTLVKNLDDGVFKYLSEEYGGKQLKLVNGKGIIVMNI